MAGAYKPFSAVWKTLHHRKVSLVPVALVAALCAFSYLLGVWQHGSVRTTSAILTGIPCSQSQTTTLTIASTTTAATAGPLDFSAHHGAESALSETVVREFPACGASYSEHTPCEDRDRSLKFPRERLVYRERHCPEKGERLKCLVPAPSSYKNPFRWPASREWAWFANVPHRELTVEKAGQNWIRVEGDKFRFPGGGTMFPRGAAAYIDDIQKLIPLTDGSIRTAIDTGCGVASWGAYLLDRNITTMSFAPRDSHEAQVQFALERGVPAMIGVLASNRLPYPSRSFDMAHCSRCLIPWHLYVDRILRPGGYWILSGPPINWKAHWKGWERTTEDLNAEQSAIEAIARSLCWKKLREKGDIAVWQKPSNHVHCKINRKVFKKPEFCRNQNPDSAWYTKMDPCVSPMPEVDGIQSVAGGKLQKWPERLTAVPPRIESGSLEGVTPEMFLHDTELWKKRVGYYKALINELATGGRFRNLLDMNAQFGGFAAALINDPLWVMNVAPVESEINTLGVIYERGLIGTYQNWCEAMSTYPRTYDLIHAASVFSLYENRCEMEDILLEMDRILRPEGTVIFRDDVDMLVKIKSITDGMKWESQIFDHEDGPLEREKILLAVKLYWTTPAAEADDQAPNNVKKD
ncbi:hypothetical protein ACLOJK_006171 [Asimina triloba]